MRKYLPSLFSTIASELVCGDQTEQYLLAKANHALVISQPTEKINKALEIAQAEAAAHGIACLLRWEYLGSTVVSDSDFSDECNGLIRVDGGQVVSIAARRIGPDVYRVLFSRVDPLRLHLDLSSRVRALEDAVSTIKVGL